MNVLTYLAARPLTTVTHDELLGAFWRGSISSTNALHKSILELRRAFDEFSNADARIDTVPKRGYRLTANVSTAQLSTTPQPATIVRIGSRSALIQPSRRNHSPIEHELIEQIHREVALRVAQVTGASAHFIVAETAAKPECDYKVDVDAREIAGRLLSTVLITPISSELPGHAERIESPEFSAAEVLNTAVSRVVDVLLVLLDDEQLQQMRAWGTKSVRAYKYAREGDTFWRFTSTESMARAEECFRLSIEADPRFGHAYRSLSNVYEQLAQDAPNSSVREQQRKKLQALVREASHACVDQQVLQAIGRTARYAMISSSFDAEAFWHEELVSNPNDAEALMNFGLLLMGSKLFDESARYLECALAQEIPAETRVSIETWYGALANARGNFEEQLRLNKEMLTVQPDLTLALYGTVRCLGALGRFQEAETYVERLDGNDPAWGWAAGAILQAMRGDAPLGSQKHQTILTEPEVSNALRGEICFLLGDIDEGVRAWRRVEATFLRLWWSHGPCNEAYYARAVVRDPRYQALLEQLGIGKTWRAYTRRQAQALAQVTGIEVTTPPPPEDTANE